MKNHLLNRKLVLIASILVGILLLAPAGGYIYWNSAPPEKTCISCHEISASHQTWSGSAHAEVGCMECHGTALSSGWHSLKEKGGMLFAHFKDEVHSTDIAMDEVQLLEVNSRCTSCHREEQALWKRGVHSASYGDIFLDEKHNHDEQLYRDCLRCHGMLFDGNIGDLVEPISSTGPWNLKDPDWVDKPSMPCLVCHKMHTGDIDYGLTDGPLSPYTKEKTAEEVEKFVLYDRLFGLHVSGKEMNFYQFYKGDSVVRLSNDPRQKLCTQCHAPNPFHQVGTSDDRTPSGVHEGLSCMACHAAHSGETAHSCYQCHPALSNCGLDVKQMNTTFKDADSPHNIHFISCEDCHSNSSKKQNLNTRP